MRAALAACALVLACAPPLLAQDAPRPIVIGSKAFPEGRLLSELLAQLIEAKTDLAVERRLGLGGTTVVFEALRSGQIDGYTEYTGTAWAVLLKRSERVTDPLRAFLEVRDGFEQQWALVWGNPFGFTNGYALAMREALAEELGVRRLSDLVRHQGKLKARVSAEFLKREDGWPGLVEAYGLQGLNVASMEHGLAYEAVSQDSAQLVEVYTTDAKLVKFELRALEDDARFFPPYDCAPVFRRETLEAHPELRGVLDELAFSIDDRRMRNLNALVELEGYTAAETAAAFLLLKGIHGSRDAAGPRVLGALARLESGEELAADLGPSRAALSNLEFVRSRARVTLRLAGEHLLLAGIAVLLTVVVSVPLGILIARDPRLKPLIAVAGVIQTIPSLALLAFMIPLLGLGPAPAIVALFLYGILPVLRNTYTGLSEVDADLLEAARAMGLTERRVLTRIQLPLAVNTIMAGVRTAAVISVGVATLGALVSAGGLGEPIFEGLQLYDQRLILAGAIPAAALAVLVDQLLGLLERALAPRGVG
ncbi:MAG: ABC transporter permease subunit [Planctomycetes bacterium]|nr:ABC transporter permease subunit [Planctomycetota bacterium]